MDINNEITQALFDMYDIKKTIESNNLNKIKRVHGGTDNEETLEELIDDVIYFLERLERIHEPLPDVFKPKLYLVKEKDAWDISAKWIEEDMKENPHKYEEDA